MRTIRVSKDRRTEKAIIDALLKISEIVQKTEINRKRYRSMNTNNKYSKKSNGDGDFHESNDGDQQQQVPVPPSLRTFDSHVSSFNETSSNCCDRILVDESNRTSRQELQNSLQRQVHSYKDGIHNSERSYKRRCHHNSSSTSSIGSNENHCQRNPTKYPVENIQEIEKTFHQSTIVTCNSESKSYQVNSATTTTLDDQSTSLAMMPLNSTAANANEKPTLMNSISADIEQPIRPSANVVSDFETCIDEKLQATLKRHLEHSSLLTSKTHKNFPQQQRSITQLDNTLTKSETGKLLNNLNITKQVYNMEYYEKQRELAMLAARQGNHALSYKIYTNLLHDNQFNYKIKSEILASRATTLLFEQKCFESINDCTQAIAFNEWNKLAYVVRAACWMIKHEYSKAVDDYSKLFYFFDQSQEVLDLLNLAYNKLKSSNDNEQLTISSKDVRAAAALSESIPLVSPTASFMQPTVYFCYPYQARPTSLNMNKDQAEIVPSGDHQQTNHQMINVTPSSLVTHEERLSVNKNTMLTSTDQLEHRML